MVSIDGIGRLAGAVREYDGWIWRRGKKECNGDARSARSAPTMILTWSQVIIREHQLGIGEPGLVGYGRLVEDPFELRHVCPGEK